jgi:hypothetical protein
MTTKCANPSCARPFLYFHSGKIYLIDSFASNDSGFPESARKNIEYFWLCGACAQEMQVTLDRNGEVVVDRIGVPTLGPHSANRRIVRAVA